MKYLILTICLSSLIGCASVGQGLTAFGKGMSQPQEAPIRCTSTNYGYTVYTECK